MSDDRPAVRPPAWRKSASTNATLIGKRVLLALARGRKALQQINLERKEDATFWRKIIGRYLILDAEQGGKPWGRGRRIADKLRGRLGERMVRKYVAQLTSGSDFVGHSAASPNFTGGLA